MHFSKIRLLLLNTEIIDGIKLIHIGCIIQKEPRLLINKGF